MTCVIDQTGESAKTICWGRGDSDAKGFIIQNSSGVAIDISGYTFKLTVDSRLNPDDATTQQFTLDGVITDAPNGAVSFTPTSVDTDLAPGTYYYDIQQIDTGAAKKTIIKGKVLIVQDITKV